MIRIVGLGPGDPDLLTLGSLEALRAIGRATTVMAPPELALFLESEGIELEKNLIERPGLFVRGSREEIDAFVYRVDAARDLGVGVLGNPLSDFPGLPVLLRALEARGIPTEIVPGVPKATLSAAIAMPLVPLPPASEHHSWEDLVEIMARLRRSCPWDREQSHRSLIPYLIEEAFEVAETVEHDRDDALCEELGDLLLQIVFHAQIGTERGKFSIADVIDTLSNKMMRRHPHVFGDQAVADVAEVWRNWEQIKATEGAALGRKSRLDGIPKALGALQRAQKMQEKASRVGFDWPDARAVTHKLAEEIAELAEAQESGDVRRIREEIGDILFTVVNVTRQLGIDAEGALREANDKFYRRFAFMEQRASEGGRSLGDLSIDELEDLWQLAKTAA